MSVRAASVDVRTSRAAAFRNVADAVERGTRATGADLDLVVEALLDHKPVDPKVLRKLILRRYWRTFYPGVRRTPAARLIAGDWLTARSTGFVEPGSREEFFRRLEAIGVTRVEVRTIIDDLDHDL